MVATIVLPRARALPDVRAALAAFEAFELRFVAEVRLSILLAGAGGTASAPFASSPICG
jgi:hypothetical protein